MSGLSPCVMWLVLGCGFFALGLPIFICLAGFLRRLALLVPTSCRSSLPSLVDGFWCFWPVCLAALPASLAGYPLLRPHAVDWVCSGIDSAGDLSSPESLALSAFAFDVFFAPLAYRPSPSCWAWASKLWSPCCCWVITLSRLGTLCFRV